MGDYFDGNHEAVDITKIQTSNFDLSPSTYAAVYMKQVMRNLPLYLRACFLKTLTFILPLFFINVPLILGGLRPVEVYLPSSNSTGLEVSVAPLIFAIHGYNAHPTYIEELWHLKDPSVNSGFVYITPVGV